MIRLTDEGIQDIINEGAVKYSGLDVPKQRQAIDRDIAKAQLKKVHGKIESMVADGWFLEDILKALLEEVK